MMKFAVMRSRLEANIVALQMSRDRSPGVATRNLLNTAVKSLCDARLFILEAEKRVERVVQANMEANNERT